MPQNLLILGHPKSGKRLTVKRLPEVQIVDFVEMATTGKWEVPAANGIIALNHVEFGIDDPEFNLRKLQLIEDLVYFQRRRTILLSTVDPLFYLTQGAPDVIVTEKQDSSDAVHLLDRWAAVLTSFRKMTIDDITEDVFKEVVDGLKRRRPDRLFQDFIKHVVRECDHTAQLRKIGGTVLRAHRDKEGLSPEALVQELLDRANPAILHSRECNAAQIRTGGATFGRTG